MHSLGLISLIDTCPILLLIVPSSLSAAVFSSWVSAWERSIYVAYRQKNGKGRLYTWNTYQIQAALNFLASFQQTPFSFQFSIWSSLSQDSNHSSYQTRKGRGKPETISLPRWGLLFNSSSLPAKWVSSSSDKTCFVFPLSSPYRYFVNYQSYTSLESMHYSSLMTWCRWLTIATPATIHP